MRKEYNFDKAVKNPHIRKQTKIPATIRLDAATVDYFKALSEEANLPYQTLINSYLTDCAKRKLKPQIAWH